MGYLSELFKVDWRDRHVNVLNSFILTGVLGGYTTFSSMQLDAAKLAGKKTSGVSAPFCLLLSIVFGLRAAGLRRICRD